MGARPAKLTIPKPAKMPKGAFVTEAELARLVKVTPGTIRAWRRRGETPAPTTGPEAEAFAESRRKSGSRPIVYRCSEVAAWLFGKAADGRPPDPPASAFDPTNDRTMQLRRAVEATLDPKEKKRIRRQLTRQAQFVSRLGFDSPTAYEAWLARGAPEGELPAEVRTAREVALREATEPATKGVPARSVPAHPPINDRAVVLPAEGKGPAPFSGAAHSARTSRDLANVDVQDPDSWHDALEPFSSNVVVRRRPGGYFGG